MAAWLAWASLWPAVQGMKITIRARGSNTGRSSLDPAYCKLTLWVLPGSPLLPIRQRTDFAAAG